MKLVCCVWEEAERRRRMHCYWSPCSTAWGCKTARHRVVRKMLLWGWWTGSDPTGVSKDSLVDKTHTYSTCAVRAWQEKMLPQPILFFFIKEQKLLLLIWAFLSDISEMPQSIENADFSIIHMTFCHGERATPISQSVTLLLPYRQHDKTPINRTAVSCTHSQTAKGPFVEVPGTCSAYSLTCDYQTVMVGLLFTWSCLG